MSAEAYGLYLPKDTIIHRLDPRAKILWFIVVLASSIAFSDPRYSIWIYASLIIVGLVARLTPKRFLLVFANSAIFIAACMVFWPRRPQLQVGPVIFELPILHWKYTEIGLLYALGKAILIVNPITAMLIIFSTTFPRDFVQGIMRLGLPYKAGYILMIALRFLPVTVRETKEIIEAQMSRGLEIERGNIIKRIRNYIPIFVPLLVRMVKETVQLGMSMESRCFGAKKQRTFLHELRFTTIDYIWSAGCLLAFAVVLFIRFYLKMGYVAVAW